MYSEDRLTEGWSGEEGNNYLPSAKYVLEIFYGSHQL